MLMLQQKNFHDGESDFIFLQDHKGVSKVS